MSRRFGQQRKYLGMNSTAIGCQNDIDDIWRSLWLPGNARQGRNHPLRQHCRRVGLAAERLAGRLGFDGFFRRRARLGGELHDIGKITVPEEILLKPCSLDSREIKIMRQHPASGARLVLHRLEMHDVLPAVLSHHERVDGRGYPHGIAGSDLCDLARVVAVADCFDAMTNDRPYRPRKPIERVREEMKRMAGQHLDHHMVTELLSMDLDDLRRNLAEAVESGPAA